MLCFALNTWVKSVQIKINLLLQSLFVMNNAVWLSCVREADANGVHGGRSIRHSACDTNYLHLSRASPAHARPRGYATYKYK